MIALLTLSLLAGCSGSSSDGTGAQDLSGYATLDDLAEMQAQIDASAAEVEALRGELEEVQAVPGLETVDIDCYNGVAIVQFDALVTPISASLCYAAEGEDACTSAGTAFTWGITSAPQTGMAVTSADCQSGVWARFTYLPASE